MIGPLLRLIAAHFVGDFIFQSDRLCEAKKDKGLAGFTALVIHALIQAILAYLFVAEFRCWQLPLLVFVSHLIIDWLKTKFLHDQLSGFIIDQCAHLIALILISYLLLTPDINLSGFAEVFYSSKIWILLIGYIVILKPTSILLNLFLHKWEPENPEERGLPFGGKWIGYLERLLIVTFVVTSNMEAIGFLLAAKSIFRFGELNKPKEVRTTEYVLIGTLSSFTIAIFIGYIVKIFL